MIHCVLLKAAGNATVGMVNVRFSWGERASNEREWPTCAIYGPRRGSTGIQVHMHMMYSQQEG